MDRQYEYVFIGDSDHHGFLSHNSDECTDPIFEKGIDKLPIAEFGLRIEESEI